MSRSFVRGLLFSALLLVISTCVPGASVAWGQAATQGTVTVTVLDPDGRVVPDATLTLQDLGTNDIRSAATQDRGNYSFVNLAIGRYKLTVSKTGFQSAVFDTIEVHATEVTDLSVKLKVGVTTETVEVHESETPLIDATTNSITTAIDMKQLEDLPLSGRDVTQLSVLVPGVTMNTNGGPTWNGLPAIAQGNNIDGVISNTSRMKFGGDSAPIVSARLEDIQEMTVQTDQLDANQGFGQASMQINFVTRRGSNSFHGRAYEDFQNSYLNANSWINDAVGQPIGHFELNDFGGSVGGPILKNKLFFFGSYAENKSPGTRFPTATVLDAAAQGGSFTYTGEDSVVHTVNVYTLAANCNATPGCASSVLSTTPNSVIQGQFAQIGATLASGHLSTPNTAFPDIQTLQWATPASVTNYFPSVRLDYNLSQNFRFNGAWNETKNPPTIAGAPLFPGSGFAPTESTVGNTFYTAAVGFDWTIRPTLVTEFRGGFLYNSTRYTNSAGYTNAPTVFWGIGTSPQTFNLSTAQYYPLINASDTTTWQHGAHNVNFGFSQYREQDHYYNPPGGIYGIQLGLSGADPALNAFTTSTIPGACFNGQCNNTIVGDVQGLYATLVGDISGAGSGTGGFAGNGYVPSKGTYSSNTYNLDELQEAWGLFAQDSWRVRPNLTLNYSLRWDFTGDDHDLTNTYFGIQSNADIYGPSGNGNLFMPGVLTGNPTGGNVVAQGHQYNPWNISPQPQIGLAWNPQYSEGLLGKLFSGGNTVIRAGFGIRRFTEPYQYFWDTAADYGFGYLQQFNIAPNASAVGTGFYQPGTLFLDSTSGSATTGLTSASTGVLPASAPCAGSGQAPYTCPSNAAGWSDVPPVYQKVYNQAAYTFVAGGPALKGFDRQIQQPYTESWNLGIQHEIGKSNAIEVRYLGNRVVHQWLSMDLNEVNAFATKGSDPSFMNQFKQAQTNLSLNNANASAYPAYAGTFAYNPSVTGEAATPVFQAAFNGESGALQSQDWGDPGFITLLQQGQAGSFANAMAQTGGGQAGADFFCNLVGQSFAGCQNIGYVGAGAGYPINYFQVNPFFGGGQTFYQTAGGYSTYHALQIDFRQKQWHGMQFDVNYTWSHNLGLATPNDWQAGFNQLTLRDLHMSYAPTIYDLRHVVHANGTYDLPFGKGKTYLKENDMLDKVVGGWTIGTIFTYQTGFPFRLFGGYNTFNDIADGGVVLNGMTVSQLQSNVGLYKNPGQPFVNFINPAILPSGTNGLSPIASPNNAAGTLLAPIYLYGPHFWDDDLAIKKSVAIRENLRFSLQGEFLNVFNHPNFNSTNCLNTSVASEPGGFGQSYGACASNPRAIELRANIEF